MIEVKALDVTASTHIQSHHTDRERLAAHAAHPRFPRAEYRVDGPQAVPLPPHLAFVSAPTLGLSPPPAIPSSLTSRAA